MATVVTSTHGLTATLSGTYTETTSWGNYDDGPAWVVIPSGTDTVTAVTPGQATDGSGDALNGIMLNPQMTSDSTPEQGYDERAGVYNSLLNETLPLTIQAGDVVVWVDSTSSFTTRSGMFDGIAALYVLASAPTNNFSPAAIGWSGRSGLTDYSVDIDTWYTNRTVYDSTGIDFPPYATLIAQMGQFNPTIVQVWSVVDGGYQDFSPFGFGNSNQSNSNYGTYISEIMGTALLAVASNVYSESEIKTIATWIICHGIQWGDPMLYSGNGFPADGGHYQWHQGAVAFALSMTGRSSELDDIMSISPGNFEQAFQITAGMFVEEFVPHSDANRSNMYRLRTLPTQTGASDEVTIPYNQGGQFSGDWYQVNIPAGSVCRNESGTKTATVASDTPFTPSSGATTGTTNVPLTGTSPFVASDIVYFEFPEGTVALNDFDWALRGFEPTTKQNFSPAAANTYRGIASWGGQIMGMRAQGCFPASMYAVQGYYERAQQANTPSASNDYSSLNHPWQFDTTSGDFYDAHWSAIAAVTQIEPATVSVTIATALTPTTTSTAMVDGLVVGLVPGTEYAQVEFKGTTNAAAEIQVKVIADSDSSLVHDWVTVANPSGSGAWSGTVWMPKSSGWWNAQVRAVSDPGNTDSIAEKWAVGYKFMLLGQSQVAIMCGEGESFYTPDPANYGKHSFYSWQAYNAGGTGIAESLVLIDGTNKGDGISVLADQFIAYDPNTPVMWVREAVSGTGLVEMLDNSNTARSITDLTDKTGKYGEDFTGVLVSWLTHDAAGDIFEGNGDWAVDIMTGDDNHGFPVDGNLSDHYQTGCQIIWSPSTRHSYSQGFQEPYHGPAVATTQSKGWPIAPPCQDYPIADGDSAHPSSSSQGSSRLAVSMATGAARCVGADSSTNPSLASAQRSLDGTQVIVSFNLPNGGSLTSPAPSAVTGFEVSEDSGSSWLDTFTTSLDGNTLVLAKTSGSWAASGSLQVRKRSSMAHSGRPAVGSEELAIVAGDIYETNADDVTNGIGGTIYGFEILGLNAGTWEYPRFATIPSVSQGDYNAGTGPAAPAAPAPKSYPPSTLVALL